MFLWKPAGPRLHSVPWADAVLWSSCVVALPPPAVSSFLSVAWAPVHSFPSQALCIFCFPSAFPSASASHAKENLHYRFGVLFNFGSLERK